MRKWGESTLISAFYSSLEMDMASLGRTGDNLPARWDARSTHPRSLVATRPQPRGIPLGV
jgi:hypothetical protein